MFWRKTLRLRSFIIFALFPNFIAFEKFCLSQEDEGFFLLMRNITSGAGKEY